MRKFFSRPGWPKTDRNLYFLILLLTGGVFFALFPAFLQEGSFVFPIEKQLVPELVKIRLFSFQNPFGDFHADINSLINFQKFKAGDFIIPLWAGRIYSVLFFVTLTILTTAIIRISNWLFYLGLSLIILFLVYFNLQEFGILGEFNDYSLYVALVISAGTIFILHNYYYDRSLRFHLIASLLLWALIWLIILVFGSGSEKLFQVGNYGFPAALVISTVFIVLIGHEPVHIFFAMISYSSNQFSRGRIVNFILLSVLYLGNAGLSYLKSIGKIDWDIIYTPFQLMLLFSILCGFYGFPKRFNSKDIFGSSSFLSILYSSLAMFTLAFLAYGYYGGHDAIIDHFEDVTLYSQLGMGTIFFFYIIVNFGDLLQENVKAYKVVYSPSRFPVLTAFIGGIVIMVAMFMRSSMFPYYQARGVIYTGMADNYLVNGDKKLAAVFYEEASVYAFNNSRSTASLAALYKEEEKRQGLILSLERSLFKNPQPVHYIDLSSQYEKNDKYFDALFTLQEGHRDFPASDAISNNLGLLYSKANAYDSAFIYFNLSDQESRERNLSALLSRVGNFNPDSLPEMSLLDDAELANRVTIYNRAGQAYSKDVKLSLLEDSLIEFGEYSLFYNLNLNHLITGNDLDQKQMNELILLQVNDEYLRDIYLLKGLKSYSQGNISEAIFDFERSVNFSGMTAAYVSDIAGTVLMSMDLDKQALEYLERANRAIYEDSPVKLLVCYTKLGMTESVQSLLKNSNLKNILGDSIYNKWTETLNPSIDKKYLESLGPDFYYAHFKLFPESWSNSEINAIPGKFEIQDLRAYVASDILNYLIRSRKENELTVFYNSWKSKLQNSAKLDEVFLRHLYRSEKSQLYSEYFENISSQSVYYPLLKAWNEKIHGNEEAYLKNAALAVEKLAYDQDVILLKVDVMEAAGADEADIYEVLVDALMVFPDNIEIGKSYVLHAVKMGLESYAEQQLEELRNKMSKSEFDDFYSHYKAELEKYSSGLEW